MNDLLRALFEAHVQHELAALRGDPLARTVEEAASRAFDWLGALRLRDVTGPEAIMGVIERYVIDFPIGGGIAELAGAMSRTIFASAQNAETRIEDILRPAAYEEFADKIVALEAARRQVIRVVTQSAAYGAFASRVIQRGVMHLLFGEGGERGEAGRPSIVASVLRHVPGDLLPDVERRVRALVARALDDNAAWIATHSERFLIDALDASALRVLADDVWDAVAPLRLADVFAFITSHDLEDFVVLGYEVWLKYRKTTYFRALAREVVAGVFDLYGDETIAAILADFGVAKAMIVEEARRSIAPVIARAVETGFAEARIRARLEAFYASDAAAEIARSRVTHTG